MVPPSNNSWFWFHENQLAGYSYIYIYLPLKNPQSIGFSHFSKATATTIERGPLLSGPGSHSVSVTCNGLGCSSPGDLGEWEIFKMHLGIYWVEIYVYIYI